MKLNTKQDIEAPLSYVFQSLTDFDAWERAAMRRGTEINRTDKLRQPGPGMTWEARFAYRGKDRQLTVRVDAMDPPGRLVLTGLSSMVEALVSIDLLELSAKRTRLHLSLDIKPKTIAARLYVQTMKLARNRTERGLALRVSQMTDEIESRFQHRKG